MKKLAFALVFLFILTSAGCASRFHAAGAPDTTSATPPAEDPLPSETTELPEAPTSSLPEEDTANAQVYPIIFNGTLLAYVKDGTICDYMTLKVNGTPLKDWEGGEAFWESVADADVEYFGADTEYAFYSQSKLEYTATGLAIAYHAEASDGAQILSVETKGEYDEISLLGIGGGQEPYPRPVVYGDQQLEADVDLDGQAEKILWNIASEADGSLTVSLSYQDGETAATIEQRDLGDGDMPNEVNILLADLTNDGVYEIIAEFISSYDHCVKIYTLTGGTYAMATEYYRYH